MVEVGEADLAKTIAGVRCRLNLFRQQGSWSAAIRLLNEHRPSRAFSISCVMVMASPPQNGPCPPSTRWTSSAEVTPSSTSRRQSSRIGWKSASFTDAMRAAMTGHLVLSTVHTNNAVSSIDRLLDIGVQAAQLRRLAQQPDNHLFPVGGGQGGNTQVQRLLLDGDVGPAWTTPPRG